MKFTGTHYTIMISVFFIGIFIYAGWNDWVLNQPAVVPTEEVEKIVEKIFAQDSVIEKYVQYTYKPATFENTGDSTCWFVVLEEKRPKARFGWYVTVKCPGPYFEFMSIFDNAISEDPKDPKLVYNRKHDYYIENFYQISEATYNSYKEFGKINN